MLILYYVFFIFSNLVNVSHPIVLHKTLLVTGHSKLLLQALFQIALILDINKLYLLKKNIVLEFKKKKLNLKK